MQRRLTWLALGCLAVEALAIGCSQDTPAEPGDLASGPRRNGTGDDDDDRPGPTSGLPKPAPRASSSSGDAGRGDAGPLGTSGDCIEIDPQVLSYSVAQEGLAVYNSEVDADGQAGRMDLLFVTDDKRTEDLSAGPSSNYRTCEYCVSVEIAALGRSFFQQSGTLAIGDTSDIYFGMLDATLTDLTLVEVTYDDEFNTTPVENGACLHVESANLSVTP